MARPYSVDLRERVVARVIAGDTCRRVSAVFGVSVSSVVKWSQRFRATGSAAAKPMGGHRPPVLAGERDRLLARLAEKPDLTLRAVLAELAQRGVMVSYGAVWAFFAKEGVTFKKKACAPASRTAPTSPVIGPGGRSIKAGLIPSAWCSSMKPGPRPT